MEIENSFRQPGYPLQMDETISGRGGFFYYQIIQEGN